MAWPAAWYRPSYSTFSFIPFKNDIDMDEEKALELIQGARDDFKEEFTFFYQRTGEPLHLAVVFELQSEVLKILSDEEEQKQVLSPLMYQERFHFWTSWSVLGLAILMRNVSMIKIILEKTSRLSPWLIPAIRNKRQYCVGISALGLAVCLKNSSVKLISSFLQYYSEKEIEESLEPTPEISEYVRNGVFGSGLFTGEDISFALKNLGLLKLQKEWNELNERNEKIRAEDRLRQMKEIRAKYTDDEEYEEYISYQEIFGNLGQEEEIQLAKTRLSMINEISACLIAWKNSWSCSTHYLFPENYKLSIICFLLCIVTRNLIPQSMGKDIVGLVCRYLSVDSFELNTEEKEN
jgi:hypothetical protein